MVIWLPLSYRLNLRKSRWVVDGGPRALNECAKRRNIETHDEINTQNNFEYLR